jgi:uncharacterized protein YjiS (DUF1127 family)
MGTYSLRQRKEALESEERPMTVIEKIRNARRKHAAYVRTRNEIARMPKEMGWDLNIFPGDAEKIAREAVYGG